MPSKGGEHSDSHDRCVRATAPGPEKKVTTMQGMQINLNMKMGQHQIMAPRMIQSMEILQMPIMDLQERIQQELDENPVLELTEPNPEEAGEFEPGEPEARDDRDPGAKELVIDEAHNNELDFDRLDALSKDWGDVLNEEHRPSRNGIDEEMDRKHDAMQNMASRPQSLQEYLIDQLGFRELDEGEAALVKHVIAHVDDVGYLSVPDESDPEYRKLLEEPDYKLSRPIRRRTPSLEEVAATFEEPVLVADVEDALATVQSLEPPGVGARDLKECLLLQVSAETPHRDLV